MVKRDAPSIPPLAACQTIEDVLTGLRERGVRATPARRLLLAALFRDRTHRSVEELKGQVQAPAVNIATIYRNLDELVRQGVVDWSYLGGSAAACHLASGGHAHLFCEHCGAMTEVPSDLFRGVTETLAASGSPPDRVTAGRRPWQRR